MSGFVISDNLGSDFTSFIFPKLIIVFIGYGLVQTIDNFINQPLIFGKSVKSHPFRLKNWFIIQNLEFEHLTL